MSRPEDQIQRAVFQHFAARSAPGVFAFAVPNGGLRSGKRNRKGVPIEAAILKGLGVRAGVPDIVAVKDGRAFFLELKAVGGRLGGKQIMAQSELREAGATVAVAVGLDDALSWLERSGLLRGSTT
jgi:hypothetical protein